MPLDPRPCLICQRPEDDYLHDPEYVGVHDSGVGPRFEQHTYDPGERRTLVRRMDDRVEAIERVVRRVGKGRRRGD